MEIKPGDTIFVPEARRMVLVFGSVGSPGEYPIRTGDRVLDVIARAGSAIRGQSSPSRTALIRPEGQGVNVYLVDLDKVIKGELREKNYEVKNGDVILVPAGRGMKWQDMVDLLFKGVAVLNLFK
jgi:protein involved in polysaccharide export with SLBB domain